MKPFIITIDTEGDNLWDWKPGKAITTKNSAYLQRFQDLCNSFGFKVVWLCNWEMIHDSLFLDFAIREMEKGHCEIGMHLHAWNTPPFYDLPVGKLSGAPYLIEYPRAIIEEKIASMTKEFKSLIGRTPISHRAGRWAINEDIFSILYCQGYKVDCSITPRLNWSASLGQSPGFLGPNYTNESDSITKRNGIMEVPLTTVEENKYFLDSFRNLNGVQKAKYLAKKIIHKKRVLYLRPDGTNLSEMMYVAEVVYNSEREYAMFMLHSSELMPGGSPVFKDERAIENMYSDIGLLFNEIKDKFEGNTLEEFYYKKQKANMDNNVHTKEVYN